MIAAVESAARIAFQLFNERNPCVSCLFFSASCDQTVFLRFVLDQLHKAIVHVQLLVTVPQRVSRIIGNKVDFNGIQRHYVDDILLQPAKPLFADLCNLKRVPVQVQWVLVSAAVTKH